MSGLTEYRSISPEQLRQGMIFGMGQPQEEGKGNSSFLQFVSFR